MDGRKRPRREAAGDDGPIRGKSLASTASMVSSSASTSSPAVKLLETEIRTLRAELQHSQSVRAIERKNSSQSESRLKRQLADAYEELNQNSELIESLREQNDVYAQQMEESRQEWKERIQWYEEQYELSQQHRVMDDEDDENFTREKKSSMLQKRLDATLDQVKELERLLKESEERAIRAERQARNAELLANNCVGKESPDEKEQDDVISAETLRSQRIKIAETERANRELQRQNADLKNRYQEMVQHRERANASERRAHQLEKDVQSLSRLVEEGKEAQRRWAVFRKEIVQEDLVENGETAASMEGGSVQPPEIVTTVRKFQALKRKAKQSEEENKRITQLSEAHLRRCNFLENQLTEKADSIAELEKQIKQAKDTISELDMENRKVVAQQSIWQRESEDMRSLLETYETQERKSSTTLSRSFSKDAKEVNASSPTIEGLTLSLNSAREEVKLITERNKQLDAELETLKNEQQEAKTEHERVLDKFHKLRKALMEERAKAEAAEARACQAETLAGKGFYNDESTRVLHLESNPLTDAIREKYQGEIDSLIRKLEEMEEALAGKQSALAHVAGTPSSSLDRGSIGSGKKDETLTSLDAQKLHKRLKERFKEQIGLFREGVYLITGFKIDMSFSESDCPRFKVRSIYGEREEDHLMFQWPKNKGKDQLEAASASLDLMTTNMARALMSGPSAIYMTKFDSVPAFMASVTMSLFEKQTII
mmetsp:Transcript_30176/g.61421  ORF Transcript_30176/g.61421 Transcript_30176/m.61421 type:complete len:719 (+) Transcript_30176:1-2157(+)